MIIRRAINADRPRVLAMGARFFASSIFGQLRAPTKAQLEAILAAFLATSNERGAVFVADQDGQAVGFSLMGIYPDTFTQQAIATALCLWVDPEARQSLAGLGLLSAFEQWATERQAVLLEVRAPCAPESVAPLPLLTALYTRRGYTAIESVFQRGV